MKSRVITENIQRKDINLLYFRINVLVWLYHYDNFHVPTVNDELTCSKGRVWIVTMFGSIVVICDWWENALAAFEGPSRWKDLYPAGAGQSQSPVDVVTEDVAWDEGIGALTFAYGEAGHSTLTNDGRTVQITLINQHQGIKIIWWVH